MIDAAGTVDIGSQTRLQLMQQLPSESNVTRSLGAPFGGTGAEGLRAKEGTMINKSLLTLGTVISKLSEGVQLSGALPPTCCAPPRPGSRRRNCLC